MNTRLKTAALASAVLMGGAIAVGATASASASTSPPSIVTSFVRATMFACSDGTCAIGPGNTAVPFAAGLDPTGGPAYGGPESNGYQLSITAGKLPPGLRLALPDAEWMILGTPTKAGTYTFTVGIVDLAGGREGFQRFTITVGTGTSDKLVVASPARCDCGDFEMTVVGFDVNVGATYTVTNASTGAMIGTLREHNSGDGLADDGDGKLLSTFNVNSPVPTRITVTDSLGSSVTVPVVR